MPMPPKKVKTNFYYGINAGRTVNMGMQFNNIEPHLSDAFIDAYHDPRVEFRTGYSAGAQIGIKSGVFRVEGEYVFLYNETDELASPIYLAGSSGHHRPVIGTVTGATRLLVHGGFINGYADLSSVASDVYPYVGLGIGIVEVDIRDITDETVLAAQAKLGIAVSIPGEFEATAGYRYLVTSTLKNCEHYLHNHGFVVGLNFFI